MSRSRWRQPDTLTRPDGEVRRVGVELEFLGLPLEAVGDLLGDTLDARPRTLSRAELTVASEHGDFRVEIDNEALKRFAREQAAAREDETSAVDRLALELFTELSSLAVPCEIVTPPLPVTELETLVEPVVRRLREAGARGTRQSLIYAFGVHLNIEPPALKPREVTSLLKAFVLLFDWLQAQEQVDVSRRATTYVSRYPADYENLLADPDYWPDWDGLIDDYLYFNPTRNRALDMLPLFASVDESRVRDVVDDPRVQARPALHYRLANCHVDEADWSVSEPWNRWLVIEALASNSRDLADACAAFQEDRRRILHLVDNEWLKTSEKWTDAAS